MPTEPTRIQAEAELWHRNGGGDCDEDFVTVPVDLSYDDGILYIAGVREDGHDVAVHLHDIACAVAAQPR